MFMEDVGILIAIVTCIVALPGAIESLSRLLKSRRKRGSRK